MKLFIVAALFTLGFAAPITETSSHTCPGGLTNSSPMCCSVNVLGLAALDCHNVPDGGCSGGFKPNCCTLGLAGQGLICNEL